MSKKRLISATLSALIAALSVSASAVVVSAAEGLPAKYDSRDYGYITSVKDQKAYGTCWAHGAIAACEASLIKNNGFSQDLDLSEFHLAYAAKHQMYDRLGMYDTVTTTDFSEKYMNDGGDVDFAANTLACWNGVVEDAAHYEQFSSNKFDLGGLDQVDFASKELLYILDAAHLSDYYIIPSDNIDMMKEYIMRYGAGTFCLLSDSSYRDEEKDVWFYNEETVKQSQGHLMAVVGWDDTISAEALSVNGVKPQRDGAFIIKNSWGEKRGKDGYYYVPYDIYNPDSTSLFFAFDSADKYTYNYGYDDTNGNKGHVDEKSPNTAEAANVFTATSDDETLEAVSFFPMNKKLQYEIKVYTDVPEKPSFPNPGTLRAEVTGSTETAGYRTVRLPEAIGLKAGERFAVVITLTTQGDEEAVMAENVIFANQTPAVKRGESYYYTVRNGWKDVCDINDFEGNVRIKAFTHSDSAPAFTEPEDYDSYNGISRDDLIAAYEEDNDRLQSIGQNMLNYNDKDILTAAPFYHLYNSIKGNAEMFTASELYASEQNYRKMLDEIRYVDPASLLLDFDIYGMKITGNSKNYLSVPYYGEFAEACGKVEEMAANLEIHNGNYSQVREFVGEAFLKLFNYMVKNGYANSYLQFFGDINNDGVINIDDVTALQKALAANSYSFYTSENGNVNGDYTINISDATCIQKLLAKAIDHFPVYDSNHYVDDAYSPDMPRERLTEYLKSAVEERKAWEEFSPSIYSNSYDYINKIIYDDAKEKLNDSDSLTSVQLLFYTRNLINAVPQQPQL